MFNDFLFTFLLSISPFGEARVGIPYGIVQGMPPFWAYLAGLTANLMVYPILKYLIDKFDKRLWRYRTYRQQSLNLVRRAKGRVGTQIQKYGFWGLMIFVMIPLPITGAYMGTIASHVFKIRRRKALAAISIGVFISCTIMFAGSYFGKMGFENI